MSRLNLKSSVLAAAIAFSTAATATDLPSYLMQGLNAMGASVATDGSITMGTLHVIPLMSQNYSASNVPAGAKISDCALSQDKVSYLCPGKSSIRLHAERARRDASFRRRIRSDAGLLAPGRLYAAGGFCDADGPHHWKWRGDCPPYTSRHGCPDDKCRHDCQGVRDFQCGWDGDGDLQWGEHNLHAFAGPGTRPARQIHGWDGVWNYRGHWRISDVPGRHHLCAESRDDDWQHGKIETSPNSSPNSFTLRVGGVPWPPKITEV